MRKWIVLFLAGLIASMIWGCGSDSGISGITTVAVTAAPAAITLAPNQTQNFTATVTGTPITAVTWSVQEANGGSINAATGAYTAPAAKGTFHVVATSQADSTKQSIATVTIGAATLTPATVTLPKGGTQTFAFSVGGTTSIDVKWTVADANGGTITATGIYTAPNHPGTFHVVATTNTLPLIQATALVTVTAPVEPTKATVQVINSASAPTGFLFSDSTVTSGTIVTWANQTASSHCVMWDNRVPASSPGAGANIPVFSGGATSAAWTAPTVTAQTVYHYHCCIHGTAMTGQVTVNP